MIPDGLTCPARPALQPRDLPSGHLPVTPRVLLKVVAPTNTRRGGEAKVVIIEGFDCVERLGKYLWDGCRPRRFTSTIPFLKPFVIVW